MTAVTQAAPNALTDRARSARIVGIDVARALAMAGMVIVHYVWPDDSGTAVDRLAAGLDGRAMPLFMLLGGLGVTLVVTRSANPDRSLLIRSGLLLLLGFGLHEASEWVAVVLQSYALFFACAPLFRRLPSPVLLTAAAAVAVAGGWTYQVMGSNPPMPTGVGELASPVDFVASLVVNGYYPFFPVASFFLLGIWIGRLDLRSDRVAGALSAIGLVIGLVALRLSERAIDAFGYEEVAFDALRRSAPSETTFTPDRFEWSRLLDTAGHSEMPAWVVSAAGTSIAVLGLSLLIGPRLPRSAAPLVALGQLALSFYAFQVVLTQVVASPVTTTFGRELLTVAVIYGGFMAFAHLWKKRFRVGPLEAVLRLGSTPTPPARP